MSEFIIVQVGQCGNQIGNEFWPLVLQEHGIHWKNQKISTQKLQKSKQMELSKALHSFFSVPKSSTESTYKTVADLERGKVKARALCIDMEDSVVANYRNGPLCNIFDKACLLTNYPGSGNNWAEGNLSHGRRYASKIENLLRKSAESCDQLHGFLLLFSVGGGTGSGLGSSLLPLLSDIFPDVHRLVTCVYPAGNDDVITAPYNAALATQQLTDHADCVFPVGNKALIDICSRMRRSRDEEVVRRIVRSKPFQDMNHIIVHMLLNLTSGARFPGTLNVDMGDIPTNMVPFPGLHYISSAISPLGALLRKEELFPAVWSRDNQLINVDPVSGVTMASLLVARGAVSLVEMRSNIDRYQKKIKVAPWSEDAIKTGLCSVPPAYCPSSVLGLYNTSSMTDLFENVLTQFKKLYSRKIPDLIKANGPNLLDKIQKLLNELEQEENDSNFYDPTSEDEPNNIEEDDIDLTDGESEDRQITVIGADLPNSGKKWSDTLFRSRKRSRIVSSSFGG
ncbi:tubulin epsilon chain-like isoform X1 [Schistocerca piceifrons]|uniref:tubulin epsilon chain-like isoform X1 n=1 Tax=Schistocerca piceifrons TaxID=274613 RepID=UPI001F5EE65D|nr:tubulin epsilon chain-like isoform X1 [Schistocerca piceifrons]